MKKKIPLPYKGKLKPKWRWYSHGFYRLRKKLGPRFLTKSERRRLALALALQKEIDRELSSINS